jgi:UDP-N-acetylmuramate dehydrogenase
MPSVQLPEVRGKIRANASLAKVTWFQVGGNAEWLFKPEDADDLAYFLANKPDDLSLTILGVGSNLLVRDGGIDGVVIRLGRGFTDIKVENDIIHAGAGALDLNVAIAARDAGVGGLEFLSGIPGTMGGALRMNGGAYGKEIADCLIGAEIIDGKGKILTQTAAELSYSYRHCGVPKDWVFTKAILQGEYKDMQLIHEEMERIQTERGESQPIKTRTGGSTFKNPEGHKAWQLIDAAGCRGMKLGGAQVSEKHCNFLINTGGATAADLENLGEHVREKVKAHSGIELEWEIARVGKP